MTIQAPQLLTDPDGLVPSGESGSLATQPGNYNHNGSSHRSSDSCMASSIPFGNHGELGVPLLTVAGCAERAAEKSNGDCSLASTTTETFE